MRRRLVGWCLATAVTLGAGSAAAQTRVPEPWTDPDWNGPPTRHQIGDYGLSVDAEYRAIALYINPISLSSETQRRASWVDHRFRLQTAVDYKKKVKLHFEADMLEGTLWGDNGTTVSEPKSNAGIVAGTSVPNNARREVGFTGEEGDDELDPDNYGYVLAEGQAMRVRRVWGDVNTPVGLLRIGRQPTTDGYQLLVASGDGNGNRFGYAERGDTTDRVLFATKPLEAFKAKELRDKSPDRGLLLVSFYERAAGHDIKLFDDDLHGTGVVLRYADPQPAKKSRLFAQLLWSHRWHPTFDTIIHVMAARGEYKSGNLTAGFEGAFITGKTRELALGLAKINNDPIVRQKLAQWGARGVVRWDEPDWTAYFEVDFASSDPDPNPGTPLRQFVFAEDNKIGLLMFPQILRFESARTAAAGVELMRRLDTPSFPPERTDTEGSFTNALAVFPQFDFRPSKTTLLRGGVLMAFAPEGVVDPIQTLLKRDGIAIGDDKVNYHGGDPGSYWGTEFDARFQWNFERHFFFDLEAALLLPGSSMEDENGQAARAVLVQGRSTFLF